MRVATADSGHVMVWKGVRYVMSPGERRVWTRLAQGHRVAKIAAEMNLSVKTVSTNLLRIRTLMGIEDTRQLMIVAVRHSLGLEE